MSASSLRTSLLALFVTVSAFGSTACGRDMGPAESLAEDDAGSTPADEPDAGDEAPRDVSTDDEDTRSGDRADAEDGTDESETPPSPVVESLEASRTTVRPGESVELAVTAGQAGETSGSNTGQLRQGLHADAGGHDAARRSSDAGALPSSDTSRRDTAISVADATPTPSPDGAAGRDTSSSPADVVVRDVRTTGDMAGGRDGAATADTVSPGHDAGGLSDAAGDTSTSPPADPVSGEIPDGWEVDWSVDDDAWTIDGEGAEATLTAPDAYRAETIVEVTVTDPEGRTASKTRIVETGLNVPPRISGVSVQPNPAEPGGEFSVSVQATDRRGDDLSYRWSAPSGWTIDDATARQTTVTAPDEAGAVADLQIEVSDGYGLSDRSRRLLRTAPNTPPRLQSVTASPPQVDPGGTVTLEAQASDNQQSDLTYRWDLPSDWSAPSSSGATIQVTAPDRYGVSANAQVTVEDNRGETDTGRVLLSTPSNEGPTIASLDAQPSSVDRGGTVQLTVQASDPEGGTLSYDWSVADSQNWSLAENGNQAQLTAPDAPGASTQVSVIVRDVGGAEARASTVVSTTPNQPPTLSSLTANPQTVKPGKQLTVKAQASDPDGDSLSYDWTSPSGWSSTENGDELTLTAPSKSGARGLVQLVVKDGQGGRATGTAIVETKANRPPTIRSLEAASNPVLQNGETTVEVEASDPDGDALDYTWLLNNPRWSSSRSGSKLTIGAPSSPRQPLRVTVVVDDGSGRRVSSQIRVRAKTCSPDRANCDGKASNGCEANLRVSDTHCGSCGNACSRGEYCDAKTCRSTRDVSAGGKHTCAMKSGRVYCWGGGTRGQLGHGPNPSARSKPVQVANIQAAVEVGAGERHTCARLPNGEVRCWGDGRSGQLGDGATRSRNKPVAVQGLTSASKLAVGGSHACALRANGEVQCWGSGDDGQLGHGSAPDEQSTPVTVQNIDTAVSIAAGEEHTCAVLQSGAVRCWGNGLNGQLGNGKDGAPSGGGPGGDYVESAPVAVRGLGTAVEVTAGDSHTCVRLQDGTLRCWGRAQSGQVGGGTIRFRETTPAKVVTIASANGVSAGSFHTCAHLDNGEASCWGEGSDGQLGNGSPGRQAAPVKVGSLAMVADIEAGMSHSCAMLQTGNVYCWGSGKYGQLGNGRSGSSYREKTPVKVQF